MSENAAVAPSVRKFKVPIAPLEPGGTSFNRVVTPLQVIERFHLDDVHFEFASSFILPDAASSLVRVATMHVQEPLAKLALFGHADSVGQDADNKKLAGRRAMAVYGLVTRDLDVWKQLYDTPHGADDWKGKSVQTMLYTLGHDPGPIDGVHGECTKAAIRAFQASQGLRETGSVNNETRDALFTAYMDRVCLDAQDQPFVLAPEDFLGGGADAKHKIDVQGCGEFNPVLVFSSAEDAAMAPQDQHTRRSFEMAPNRRVTFFFFAPGVQVAVDPWPCPNVDEGPEGCKKRFWSDGETRRKAGGTRREYVETRDTYACRFYDRLALSVDPEEPGAAVETIAAQWSKAELEPLRNSSYPPASAPTDTVPEACRVELVVQTRGVPDETPARIQIKHAETGAAIPGGNLENLVVRGDVVVDRDTGEKPVWSFGAEHDLWDPWDRPWYFFSVEVEHASLRADSPKAHVDQPDDVLRILWWFVSASDAIADTPAGGGLTTQEEMNEIADLLSPDPHRKIGRTAFNQVHVSNAEWGSVIRNSYGYHHSSHGDFICRVDGAQFDSGANDMPTVCPHDPSHPGRSVIYIGDSPFGDAECSDPNEVPSTPRVLAYLNTCVAGFESSFADALIARGTRNVIAFRKYIPDDDAREMARQFYRKWTQVHKGDPEKIPEVFFSVAPPFYDSMRPVLFGAGGGAAGPLAAAASAVGSVLPSAFA